MSARSRRPDENWKPEVILKFDGIEESAGLVGCEDGRFAALDDVLRPADGACRVNFDNVADDEPVEEHPDGGQVLLDRRRRGRVLLDIGGDDDGLDLVEFEDAAGFAPLKETGDGVRVGGAGVFVADVGGEELDEAPAGALASARNCRRQRIRSRLGPGRDEAGSERVRRSWQLSAEPDQLIFDGANPAERSIEQRDEFRAAKIALDDRNWFDLPPQL